MRALDSYAPPVKEGCFDARLASRRNWNPGSDRNGATVLNWFIKPEEALMLHTVSPLILKLSLFLMTAVATHLVMSFGQTLRSLLRAVPRTCLLTTRDCKRPLEIRFRFCRVRLRRHQRDFSSDAMDLRPAHVPGTLAASP